MRKKGSQNSTNFASLLSLTSSSAVTDLNPTPISPAGVSLATMEIVDATGVNLWVYPTPEMLAQPFAAPSTIDFLAVQIKTLFGTDPSGQTLHYYATPAVNGSAPFADCDGKKIRYVLSSVPGKLDGCVLCSGLVAHGEFCFVRTLLSGGENR